MGIVPTMPDALRQKAHSDPSRTFSVTAFFTRSGKTTDDALARLKRNGNVRVVASNESFAVLRVRGSALPDLADMQGIRFREGGMQHLRTTGMGQAGGGPGSPYYALVPDEGHSVSDVSGAVEQKYGIAPIEVVADGAVWIRSSTDQIDALMALDEVGRVDRAQDHPMPDVSQQVRSEPDPLPERMTFADYVPALGVATLTLGALAYFSS